MSKIYLPVEVENSNCAYVYDKDTIRVYEEVPRQNATINYIDYFINSDYISRTGSTTFNSWGGTISYNCLSPSDFTTSAFYRTDIGSIVIVAFALIFMGWFLISRLYRRLFYGRKTI